MEAAMVDLLHEGMKRLMAGVLVGEELLRRRRLERPSWLFRGVGSIQDLGPFTAPSEN
jgi:hypothetical protein